MEFRLLGPVEASDGGNPLRLGGGKQRALLALLLLNPNRVVAVERIVDALWGESLPETAVKGVQIYVSRLRKVLPEGRLETKAPGYLLRVEPDELDLTRVEKLFHAGQEALAAGRPEEASVALATALELWRGPALAEFEEPFAAAEAARLEELRLTCLEERIEADLALGRHARLVGELEALVAEHRLRERLRGQQMLALYRSGRQAEALSAYQEFRSLHADELGIEPSQRLRELERRILQQDPALELPTPEADGETPTSDAAPEPAAPSAPSPGGREPATARHLVGREAELRQLEDVLGEALAGRRVALFVRGEAGIGKTTLVDAFLRRASGRGVLVGRGQCVEHRGAGEAYLPVLDALGRLGRQPEARLKETLFRFAPTWLAQLPGLLEPEELETLQGRILGATRERMLREMLDALDELARERPVALVLEDLHWADYSTLELVEAIARRRDPAHLLVIGTLRPFSRSPEDSEADRIAHGLALRSLAVELSLEALDEAAVAEYLGSRLPESAPPAPLQRRLLELTRGSPLFLEKVVDTWIEDGLAERVDGRWELVAGHDELLASVPASLRELCLQRLGDLSPDEQALLEAACVAGADFSAALVAAASELSEEEAERLLDRLARTRTFVEARGEERWPDGTVGTRFAFTHDLFHEVLYERLPAGRRARLHGRMADRLAAAWGARAGEIAVELAFHSVQARDAEAGVRHLVLAADRALERTAQREAIDHLTAGLELLERLSDGPSRDRAELALRIRLGPAQLAVEGWGSSAAEHSLARARELAERLGSHDELATILFFQGTMHEIRGEYRRSQALIEETLSLPQAPAVDSRELLACSLFHQGAFERALGEASLGVECWDGSASPLTAAYGDNPGIACHAWAALASWFLGRPDESSRHIESALERSRGELASSGRALALGQAAILAQLRDEPDTALEYADTAIETGERGGFTLRRAVGRIVRGWARAVLDDPPSGIAELERGIQEAHATDAHMDDPYYLGLLADAKLRAGRPEAALTDLSAALSLVRRSRTFFYEPELHRLRGEALVALGRPGDARAAFREALERARRGGSPPLEARAARSLSKLEGEAAPAELPERSPIRYARSAELSIAYQVTGEGPVDVVLVPGFVSHLEKDWEEPRHARFLERLGSFARLIRFDKRGTGLSDRPAGLPDLETRMDDVRAVMDAAESERAVLFGYSEGGPLSILFAATYPERVSGLVLYGTYAKRIGPDEDYPWAQSPEERSALIESLFERWGFESHMKLLAPSADEAMARWWNERCRAAASPGAIRALMEMNSLIDVRHVLAAIHVPTLVVHRTGDARTRVEEGRYIAERIPGARFVELPGDDHFVAIDPDQILDVVEPFVRGLPAAATVESDRVLATILITDIVGSTEVLARVGDQAWAELLARHDRAVGAELRRFSGELVDSTGDGVIAVFHGPTRALRCARSIAAALAGLGLQTRIGVHTGEVERCSNGLRGIAVHLAARVAAEAAADEVLVTATTRDLVAGSGIEFADRGEHALKGIEEPRRLYAVTRV